MVALVRLRCDAVGSTPVDVEEGSVRVHPVLGLVYVHGPVPNPSVPVPRLPVLRGTGYVREVSPLGTPQKTLPNCRIPQSYVSRIFYFSLSELKV